jgi:hypothetical protein
MSSKASTLMVDPAVNPDGGSVGVGDAAVGTLASSLTDVDASPIVSMTKMTRRVRTWMRSRRSSVGKR